MGLLSAVFAESCISLPAGLKETVLGLSLAVCDDVWLGDICKNKQI